MQSPSFYAIEKETITIRDRLVKRAKFGLHLKLANLSQKLVVAFEHRDIEQCSSILNNYFQLNNLDLNESGIEAIYEFLVLLTLNDLKFTLPFMTQKADIENNEAILPYEYDGRIWVHWIHKIAKTYNWTKDYILNLFPEEIICFIQEIMLEEYNQLEIVRTHSEVAYSYDQNAKKYKYIPMPKPAWMMEEKKQKLSRILKTAMPVGNIVNLDNFLPN